MVTTLTLIPTSLKEYSSNMSGLWVREFKHEECSGKVLFVRILDGSGLELRSLDSYPWVWAAGLHWSSWLIGEEERGDLCDGERPSFADVLSVAGVLREGHGR